MKTNFQFNFEKITIKVKLNDKINSINKQLSKIVSNNKIRWYYFQLFYKNTRFKSECRNRKIKCLKFGKNRINSLKVVKLHFTISYFPKIAKIGNNNGLIL